MARRTCSCNRSRPARRWRARRVEIIGRNGLPVLSETTDAAGHVRFPDLKSFQHERAPVLYLARRGGDSSFLPIDGRDRVAGFLALRCRRRRKQRRPRRAGGIPVLRPRHLSARRTDPRGRDRSQPGLERQPRWPAAAAGSHGSARHRRCAARPSGRRRRLRRDPAADQGNLADRHLHAVAVDRAQISTRRSDRLDDGAGARLPAGPPAHEGRLLQRIARRLGRSRVARRATCTSRTCSARRRRIVASPRS